jgi:hypothetical protein
MASPVDDGGNANIGGGEQQGRELAIREGVDNSYVSRMINLTLLPPWTIAAILDDTLPDNITLLELPADPRWFWSNLLANFPIKPR